jgi:pimeloyl-ACP methyl ester carboxylesterase
MLTTTSYLSRFNYQLYGPENGRKWIFLHGLMGYGSNWRKITSQLPQERILVFDQRGHGRSWKPMTGYASEDYADDVHLIAQDLGWDRFILVGHSMGGRNALSFAHKYPDQVEKLVIEDIGPDPDMNAIAYYQNMLSSVPTPFASKLLAKEFFMNEWPKLGVVHENVLTLGQYLYSNLQDTPEGKVDWRFSKDAIMASVIQGRAKDAWHELRTLTMPTLVIRGENSRELSKESFQRMLASNKQIQGVEISNAGHWVHADQASQFAESLLNFANR